MKNKLFIMIFLALGVMFSAQIKKLNDEAIVSQHKRMVFEQWGDWRPYPKYFLGVQTNWAYATLWGSGNLLTPSRNERYRKGPDIRPLRLGGKEMLRQAEVQVQENAVVKTKIEVDSIYARNMADFAHWTPITTDADPLWILYYKRRLSPLHNFPDNPQNYKEWGFESDEIYQKLQQYGFINVLQRELDLLKDKYNMSKKTAMPRGKRFLMYHETMLEWRNFEKKLKSYRKEFNLALNYKDALDKFKRHKPTKRRTDTEIIQEIINKYRTKS